MSSLWHEWFGLDLHIGGVPHTVGSLVSIQTGLTVRHVDLEHSVPCVSVKQVFIIFWMHRLLYIHDIIREPLLAHLIIAGLSSLAPWL